MKSRDSILLALDLGSSEIKAAAARPTGRLLSVCRLRSPVVRPAGASDLTREFDIPELRRTIARALSTCMREAGVRSSGVAGIAVTGQREAIALLDRLGAPLYAGPNNDLRGAFEGAAIDDGFSAEIWQTTGHLPSFMLAWSKLAWFREESPEIYGRAAHVLTLADWVVLELTGEMRIERSLGVEAGLVEVASGQPARSLATALGLNQVAIPEAVSAGEIIGVTRSAAASYRLAAGIPVVNAGPDTQAALVGMGVAQPGHSGIVAGWSGAVQRIVSNPVRDPARGLWTGRHVVPGRYVVEGNAGVMGGAYQWLVGIAYGSDADAYRRADLAATRSGRSAGSVSAHLGPAALNMSRSSLRAGGFVFPVPLALEPPDAGQLCRAAIENFAFAFRSNLEKIGALVGQGGEDFTAAGGGLVRSKTFRRVLADVLPGAVRFGHPDSSLLGAISLAASATGMASLESAMSTRKRACRPVERDPAAAREYDHLYDEWCHRGDILAQIGL